MEYIIRHQFRDMHNALLKIFSQILKDKYQYIICDSKEEKRKEIIVGMGMRMVAEKEFSVTFYAEGKKEGSNFNFPIKCELTMKEFGLGELAIFSTNEDEAYTALNTFKFLTKEFYRAQLDRELLGE